MRRVRTVRQERQTHLWREHGHGGYSGGGAAVLWGTFQRPLLLRLAPHELGALAAHDQLVLQLLRCPLCRRARRECHKGTVSRRQNLQQPQAHVSAVPGSNVAYMRLKTQCHAAKIRSSNNHTHRQCWPVIRVRVHRSMKGAGDTEDNKDESVLASTLMLVTSPYG